MKGPHKIPRNRTSNALMSPGAGSIGIVTHRRTQNDQIFETPGLASWKQSLMMDSGSRFNPSAQINPSVVAER